jgi:hypothetical protein
LGANNIGPEGAQALAESLRVNASLTKIDVRHNKITGEGASQLSSAVLSNKKLEYFNEIPLNELRADNLTELNLFNKDVGVPGALVLAELLLVSASLTKLDVRYNSNMGEEGMAALRKAVEGRSGVELVL